MPLIKNDKPLSGEARLDQAMLEALRSDPKSWREWIRSAQLMLGRLGYGTGPFDGILDEKTQKALREYQAYNGLPVSEYPDFDTVEKIAGDYNLLDKSPVMLPGFSFYGEQWEQWVSAQGTWAIANESQGIPFQTSVIHCHREWNSCIESAADVGLSGGSLFLAMNYYEIDRWDDLEIVTKPKDYLCTRYTIRISRSQKTVTGLRTTKNATGELAELCKDIEKRDFSIHLNDGKKVWEESLKKHNEIVERVLRMESPISQR